MNGADLPRLRTEIPGPASRERVDVLARHECPAITARRARRAEALGAADDDPIVWEEAVGANVRDVDGNVFVDLTSGFGVAFVGHRHPAVVAAAHDQEKSLVHAMGDAFPDTTRIALLERLAAVAPGDLSVSILGLSGSDAIDAAVRTATLATGRTGVLTFEGGYHGLALGVVGLQAYHAEFTAPFKPITHPGVTHLPWACPIEAVEEALASGTIGLVLVEPVQGRGGMREPPPGWLARVAQAARKAGAIVAFDEIYTGLGRTGRLWGCTDEDVVPDLMCVGKSLGGGFPISACIGTRAVMDAWGASKGEALLTQTFLGHPVGCAAALAVLDLVEQKDLPARAAALGETLAAGLRWRSLRVRGRGLLLGVEIPKALAVSRALMRKGFLALPAGVSGEVLAIAPPVCLTRDQAAAFLLAFDDARAEVA
jgi:4-aminobutyrate aminotransferase/(S)-3-amino-2-methylpropionate transaminase